MTKLCELGKRTRELTSTSDGGAGDYWGSVSAGTHVSIPCSVRDGHWNDAASGRGTLLWRASAFTLT